MDIIITVIVIGVFVFLAVIVIGFIRMVVVGATEISLLVTKGKLVSC